MDNETPVAVIGCGVMGSGIAEVAARCGLQVIVVEQDGALIAAGQERIEKSIGRAVSAGKITAKEQSAALSRLRFSTELSAISHCVVVFEAIAELEDLKLELYRELDRVVSSKDAIFASNTSSIPIAKIGAAISRPDRVLGVHFFNPVAVMPLVEITASLLTDQDVVDAMESLVRDVMGKTVVHAKDRAGFIVNALLVPYLLSAIRMFEAGVAGAEAIDAAMEGGCAHPMGPLRLSDLIGLDTLQFIADALYEEFKDPACAPPSLLLRMVDAKLLGRKTGRGFYTY